MSTAWTYQDLSDKVRNDLDMTDELIVTEPEMLGYANAAVEEVQAEILGIYEDYYLTHYDLALVQGQPVYALPAGIYAEKIRGVVYTESNTIIYDVRRLRGSKKFSKIAWAQNNSFQDDDYRYFLENPSLALGYQMNIVPLPRASSGFLADEVTVDTTTPFMRVWYIREAVRFVSETDLLDIPQFAQFVIEFMKGMCKAKENGGQMPPDAAAMIEQKRKLMVDSLTRMVPDDDDTVEADFSPYTEMT